MSFVESIGRLFSAGGKAATFCDRGIAKAKLDDWLGAIGEYTAAIDVRSASRETVAKARFNRALAYARLNDPTKAEADLKAVIDMPGVPEQIRASAKEKLLRWGKRRGN